MTGKTYQASDAVVTFQGQEIKPLLAFQPTARQIQLMIQSFLFLSTDDGTPVDAELRELEREGMVKFIQFQWIEGRYYFLTLTGEVLLMSLGEKVPNE
jgi:hypothetical protein